MIPRLRRALITDATDSHDIAAAIDSAEPTERTEANDPIEPIEHADPMLPIERTEFLEAIERTDPRRPRHVRLSWMTPRRVIQDSRTC